MRCLKTGRATRRMSSQDGVTGDVLVHHLHVGLGVAGSGGPGQAHRVLDHERRSGDPAHEFLKANDVGPGENMVERG
jgi:hypothetical protein